jgi:hypothetical protein
MIGISDKVAKDFGLGDDQWELMAFNLVNGTSVDISIDLFDPQVANTVNIPTSPSPSLISPPFTYNFIQSPPLTTALYRNTTITFGNSKVWTGDDSALLSGDIQSTNENTFVVNTINLPAQVGNSITGISYSATSDKIIVGGSTTTVVTILDATTETIITNTALVGAGVSYIIWNSVKNTWYIARTTKQVDEVDCVTNALVSSILLSGTANPRSIAFDSVTNRIYVTDDSSPLGIDANAVFEIDCATNTVISTISTTGIIARPFGIGFKYVSGVPTLYLGSTFNAGIYAYNLITTSSTAISLTSFSTNFLIHPTSNTVYSGGWLGGTSGELLLIDALTNTVTDTINYTQLQKIVNITYSPTTNNLYFSTYQFIGGLNNLLPPTAFYISGDSNINQIVRDGFYSPYWIRRLYFYSSNTQNFNQNFFLLTKDANGNLCEFPQVPSLSVATLQFQAGIGLVDYPNKEFILGINQWYKELKVVANSELSMILVYQQIEKSDLLSYIDKAGKGVGSMTYDGLANVQAQKYNLNQLDYIMPVNALVLPKDEIITPLNVQELNNILSNAITNSSDGTS